MPPKINAAELITNKVLDAGVSLLFDPRTCVSGVCLGVPLDGGCGVKKKGDRRLMLNIPLSDTVGTSS